MSGKIKEIYNALVEGAVEGLAGRALYLHVKAECPKATSKRIVKASLRALTDPSIRDASLLRVIYALAIEHRLDPVEAADCDADDEEGDLPPPAPVSAVAAVEEASVEEKPKTPVRRSRARAATARAEVPAS